MPFLTMLLHTGSAQNPCICTLTGTELSPVTAGTENAEGERGFPSLDLPLSVPGHPPGCLLANPGQQEAFTLFQVILNAVLNSYSYRKLQGSQHQLTAWLAVEVEGLDALYPAETFHLREYCFDLARSKHCQDLQ